MGLKSIITAVLSTMLLVSCATKEEVRTDSVKLDSTSITLVKGDSHKLTATVTPDNSGEEVVWSSADTDIATVDENGLVTAIEYGETIVTAVSGNKSARCQVTVTKRLAESVTIDPAELTIMKCEQKKLVAKVLPENADENVVLWKSSDESIATVAEDGTLTAVAVGQVTVTATVGGVSGTCEVTVTGIPASGLSLDPATADVLVGYNVKLKAVIEPENADEKDVVWESGDESVCTVDSDGTVTAVAVGSTDVTARLGDLEAVCRINVILPEANVGDFYYSDGTWSTELDSQKECIGIVFYVGQHENDNSDYSQTGIGKTRCNGYVVALQDAAEKGCAWGPTGKELGCFPFDSEGEAVDNYSNNSGDNDWSGYKYTGVIKAEAEANGGLSTTELSGYPAVSLALAYEDTVPAPGSSSGWFLPAISQLWCIYENTDMLANSGAGLKVDWYWSSSEDYWGPSQGALILNALSAKVMYSMKTSSIILVRPVLAF